MQVKKQVRTGTGTTDWFQTGKGVREGCIVTLTSMQSTSCEMPGWMKHNLELRLLGEMSITSDMQITPLLWQKQRGTKEPFDKSEKAGLNLNIHKVKIMASGPITSWQMDGETGETVTGFIFSGSKITADGDCSLEEKL